MPANINMMLNSRSHMGCWTKLTSPKPTVVIVSALKYKESSHVIPGGRW